MTNNEIDRKSAWTTVLDTYRERKAQRATVKVAERELSSYTTPAELQDLDAMLERFADEGDTVYGPMVERIRLRAA
jgi:molybdopterin-guanine dinucleotide biosynthesis protein